MMVIKIKIPVKLRKYDTRFACIVLLAPNIEKVFIASGFITTSSDSLIEEDANTDVLDPDKSVGHKPASIMASIDFSRNTLVIVSIISASFGWTLKNVVSNLSMFFNFPVPDMAPKASVMKLSM